MKVCLGVVDQPYGYGDEPEKTTFEVAQELEERYEIFSRFWEMHNAQIRSEVGEIVAYALINHIRYGAPMPGGEQLADTMTAFHTFLDREEMAGLTINGNKVPTWSAIHGVNSRLKIKRGERRPSFIDGGLFKDNFIAWIDDDAES
ncbi:hypothetical protein [Escherichia coli]|uniref:hypothetical protein n=1 Tax=Escherichia coli TaxID=562 RepID=UPI001918E102|nr:hypothetical protein [Escherichia coli]